MTIVSDDRQLQRRSLRVWPLTLAFLVIALVVSTAANAGDLARRVQFDIPVQPLAASLRALANQADIQIIFSPADVAGHDGTAISGAMSAGEALDRLLDATPLEFVVEGEDTIVVRLRSAAAVPAAAVGLPSAPASGAPVNTVVEEVVVTAQKREERLQDVPIAMTAMSAQELKQKGITSFDGVAAATPSISFSPFPLTSSAMILYMRGQGSTNPTLANFEGAVGLYQDGFFIGRGVGANFDMGDLERVEVLRGPQGTLYGRNTTGGAVNLISRKPSGEFGFKQTLELGNRDAYRVQTIVDLPEWANLSMKATLLKSAIDGYVRNAGPSHDFGEEEKTAGRLQLHWNASETLEVDYFFDKGSIDATPGYYQNPALNGRIIQGSVYFAAPDDANRVSYRPIDLRQGETDYEGHGLTLSWDVGDALTVKSLTGYRSTDGILFQDFANGFQLTPTFSFNQESVYAVRAHQFSQELQLIGSLRDGHVTYVGGLYHFEEDSTTIQDSLIPEFFSHTIVTANAKAKSQAIYGQLTWTPDFRLELTLGVRFTRDERSVERFQTATNTATNVTTVTENGAVPTISAPLGATADLSFDRFDPTFTVNYKWTDEISSYVKIATGYRAGGAHIPSAVGMLPVSTFEPEKLTSYEFGLKSYWLQRRVRLNAAVFNGEFDDMQLVYPTDATNRSISKMVNAGKATIRGVELEALIRPVEDLSVNVSYTYMDAEVDEVGVLPGSVFDGSASAASPYRVGDNIASLFAIAHAPEHSLAVGLDYTLLHLPRGDMTLSVNYRWQDESSQQPIGEVSGRHFNVQPSYGLLDARLTLATQFPRGDRLSFSLWGKNLTDEKYPQHIIANGGGNVPAAGVVPGYFSSLAIWAPPATYGVALTYEF